MKKLFLIFAVILFAAIKVNAQCTFTPTITPSHPILCPNSTDTLYTEPADSYQWYKNNQPISGATNPYLIVDDSYVASLVKVASTINGCTAFSKRVLVDGYVFLLPYFIHSGDLGVYEPKINATVLCPGDTLILTMGNPYSVNVHWYNNGHPIAGATQQSYYVTHNGSYTACGAPAVCPDYIQCQNLAVNVVFEHPAATITETNDTLFASKAKAYQWLFNNNKIAGATKNYYVPNAVGRYRVITKDKYTCYAVSDPYLFMTVNKLRPKYEILKAEE